MCMKHKPFQPPKGRGFLQKIMNVNAVMRVTGSNYNGFVLIDLIRCQKRAHIEHTNPTMRLLLQAMAIAEKPIYVAYRAKQIKRAAMTQPGVKRARGEAGRIGWKVAHNGDPAWITGAVSQVSETVLPGLAGMPFRRDTR